MDAMSTRALVTNEQVAKDLGISHSMVSRLRSGDRHPSVNLMNRIKDLTRWKVESQMRLFATPQYAEKFEAVLAQHYDEISSGES